MMLGHIKCDPQCNKCFQKTSSSNKDTDTEKGHLNWLINNSHFLRVWGSQCIRLITCFHTLLQLKVSGAVTPLPHLPSQHMQWKLCTFTVSVCQSCVASTWIKTPWCCCPYIKSQTIIGILCLHCAVIAKKKLMVSYRLLSFYSWYWSGRSLLVLALCKIIYGYNVNGLLHWR